MDKNYSLSITEAAELDIRDIFSRNIICKNLNCSKSRAEKKEGKVLDIEDKKKSNS